ncbi:TetR/AcrR family transcriptional regulator [Actinoplanes sp. CA-252034]|uniref:TetR/AcrR family transcriptional regulator n=1 Tax=Actinoplanes sp. CA-252034 TaxID=3239906 RepID=UPI003D98281D
MPLPRFDRLAPEARAAILAVARAHFARDGRDGASLNRIIADAGISKTSAYHYFDGKDDLFAAVAADTTARVVAALGPWTPVRTADELWKQLSAGSARLSGHLREHPDDRAVLAAGPPAPGPSAPGPSGPGPSAPGPSAPGPSAPGPSAPGQDGGWIAAMVADGVRIGLIDAGPGVELITAATAAVIGVADARALERPDEEIPLRALLERLWSAR